MIIKVPDEICGMEITKIDMVWHIGDLHKTSFSLEKVKAKPKK